MAVGQEVSLRKRRELLGLRPEEVVARLKPTMSVRTLERWETNGVPTRRDANRDAWLTQLTAIYERAEKQNGKRS